MPDISGFFPSEVYAAPPKFALTMTRAAPYEYIVHQTNPETRVGDKRLLTTDFGHQNAQVVVLGVYESYGQATFVKRTLEGSHEEQNLSKLLPAFESVVNELKCVTEKMNTSSAQKESFVNTFYENPISPPIKPKIRGDSDSPADVFTLNSSELNGTQTPTQTTTDSQNNLDFHYSYYPPQYTSTPVVNNNVANDISTNNSQTRENVCTQDDCEIIGPPEYITQPGEEPLGYYIVELIAELARFYHIGKAHRDTFFAKLLATVIFRGGTCSRKEDESKFNWIMYHVKNFFPESPVENEADHIRENRIGNAILYFCKLCKDGPRPSKKRKRPGKILDPTLGLAKALKNFKESFASNQNKTISENGQPQRYRSVPAFNVQSIPVRKSEIKPCIEKPLIEAPANICLASIALEPMSVIHGIKFKKDKIDRIVRRVKKEKDNEKRPIIFAAKLVEEIFAAKKSHDLTNEEKVFVYENTKKHFSKYTKQIGSMTSLHVDVENHLRKL